MPFTRDAVVEVRQLDDENWQLRQPLRYRARREVFEVPAGQDTDFASVPRAFIWFLPRYGSYTMAAIVHDYLWRVRAATGQMKWVDADGIFRRAMRELRVPFLRRWIMWTAVRWAALFKPRGREGWLREAPRVVLMSAIALPFVAVPGVVILVSLAAFYVLELLAWIPIQLGALFRARVLKQTDRKEVILPRLDLTTTGPPPAVTAPAVEELEQVEASEQA